MPDELSKESKSLAEHCAEFMELFLPKNAGDRQIDDMRTCFYAGAQSVLIETLLMIDLSDDEAVKILDALHEETNAFTRRYKIRHKIF